MLTTGNQMKAARALAGFSQITLAKRSRVAIGTIRRMESFDGIIQCTVDTLHKVQAALERGGIDFLNHERPGVRLTRHS